ncbi:hypothetical protein ACMGE7_02015 [Macrococcus equi]|uniref:hypothetical protein n=1 Tax=Macrococcus equi TaxID=3395462 RepID=UPI0039BE71E0
MSEKKLDQILKNQERIEKRLENIEMLLVNLVASEDKLEGLFDIDNILETLERHYKKLKSEVNIDKIEAYVEKNNMKQVQNFVRYAFPIKEGLSILIDITSEETFEELPIEKYLDVVIELDEIELKYEDNDLFQKFYQSLQEENEEIPF